MPENTDAYVFEAVTGEAPLPALQGSTTNALVHNPFAWESSR